MVLVISIIIGFVLAFVVSFIIAKTTHSVNAVDNASMYIKEGSFNVTNSQDIFLYRTETRRKIEKKEN